VVLEDFLVGTKHRNTATSKTRSSEESTAQRREFEQEFTYSWHGWPPADPRPWPGNEHTSESNSEPLRRILNPNHEDADRSQPPDGMKNLGRAEGRETEAAGTYRVLDVDATLDDLPAAPGHDGDLHPAYLATAHGGSGAVMRRQMLSGGGGDGTAREWTDGGGVFDPARGVRGGPSTGGERLTHLRVMVFNLLLWTGSTAGTLQSTTVVLYHTAGTSQSRTERKLTL
jgi:hypothetical protein